VVRTYDVINHAHPDTPPTYERLSRITEKTQKCETFSTDWSSYKLVFDRKLKIVGVPLYDMAKQLFWSCMLFTIAVSYYFE
jgi:hypothetical protein